LTFAAGETSKTLTIYVSGDLAIEADEGFTVTLSNASGNAQITTAAATGTIQNDDFLVSNNAVTEAAAPKNWTLESNEKLKITWLTSSQYVIVSQTLWVDGKKVTPVTGIGNHYFSCIVGPLGVGVHHYTISATTWKGYNYIVRGEFTVVAPIPPTIANVSVTEAASPKNWKFESNEDLRLTWTASSQYPIASQTIKVDNKTIAVKITRVSGNTYTAVIGKFAVGTHKYTLTSTDSKGTPSTVAGSFSVIAPIQPTVTNVSLVEAGTPKNVKFESNERLTLSWNASSQYAIASHTIKVDGKTVKATVNHPKGTTQYNCTIGPFSVGVHAYSILSVDAKGVGKTVTGKFSVVTPVPPTIANIAVVESANPKNGAIEPTDALQITWTASSQYKIASQTLTVDGKTIKTTIKYSSTDGVYSCIIGKYAIGKHKFTIKSTDAKGTSASSNSSFAVTAAVTTAASLRRSLVAASLLDTKSLSLDEMVELAVGSVGAVETSTLDAAFASLADD
jgi:hypothetical protein